MIHIKMDFFSLNATLRTEEKVQVTFELLDASGICVWQDTKDSEGNSVTCEGIIENVHTWTAETPYLYQLLMTVKQGDKVIEVIPQKSRIPKYPLEWGYFPCKWCGNQI